MPEPRSISRRVLMYSHDTFGLGHLTRTLRIAEAIQARYSNVSILILSGLPVAPYLPLPPRTDLVKLPSVLKSGPEQYQSRDLDVDFKQIRAIRRSVIKSTAETFRPHVFLVDNVPLGMKGEILPTLELLRGKAKCVLNLRDILDEPDAIRERWSDDGVHAALDRFYDAIHVFGDERIFDAIEAYGLPVEKTQMLGYVTPNDRVPSSALPFVNGTARPRKVLVTAGGGGDGLPLLESAIYGLAEVHERGEYEIDIEVVTGPLMEDEARKTLLVAAAQAGATVLEFVPDMPGRMRSSDLVIAMAGYNTCSEILSCGAAALLHPRTHPRLEQKVRADAFESLGLARALPGGEPSPSAIADAVDAIFRDGHRLDESALPMLSGQRRSAEALSAWLEPTSESDPAPAGGGRMRIEDGGTDVSGGLLAQAFSVPTGRVDGKVSRASRRRIGLRSTWVPPWPGAIAASV
ncbi:MAG: glycosyltransferase [Candidatus Eisenbacteria bacterium]